MSIRFRKWLTVLFAVCVIATAALSLQGQESSGKKYALLVGVKAYDHSSFDNLNYTENDVTVLAEVLRGRGYQVTLLCDTDGKKDPRLAPTRANIVKHLDEVTSRCKRSDTLLLAFAGHGLQYKEEKSSHFCPSDARPNDPKTLVSLGDVYRQLDESGAGAKLVLVDACRVTPRARGRGGLDGDNAPHPPKGTAIMFACSPGQSAFESNELRHGVFFYYVLEGLSGKAKNTRGEVTWNSLTEHVQHNVSLEAPKRFGTDQDPNVVANLAGAPPVLVAAVLPGGTSNTEATLEKRKDVQSVDQRLRQAINRGADLFKAGKPGECCEVYRTELLAVRGDLGHRPELQQLIDTVLKRAEGKTDPTQLAFAYREVADEVRAAVKRTPDRPEVTGAAPLAPSQTAEASVKGKPPPPTEHLLPKVQRVDTGENKTEAEILRVDTEENQHRRRITKASSAEFVGEFWLWEVAKSMI